MKILVTICGRKGSKGIVNKNIRDFCGYPLSYYSLSAIDLLKKENQQYDIDVVINSDSEELIAITKKNPFFSVDIIKRKAELGGDTIPKVAVIGDCIKQMQRLKDIKYSMLVDLDITSPLRTVEDIENLIKTHLETGADVTASVTDSRRNPYFNMLKKTDHGYQKVLDSNCTARQQAPAVFDMNASLYAYKPEFLNSGKGVLDGYCECIHMEDTGILDLDHENDFELMQVIADYLYMRRETYGRIQKNIEETIRSRN